MEEAREETGTLTREIEEEALEEAKELTAAQEARERAEKKAGGRAAVVRQVGKMEYRLTEPFEWCDITYEKFDLDFMGLTGVDMEAIDDQMAAANRAVSAPAQSRRYQKLLAARAAHVPSDVIEHLPLADYNAVTTMARNFLLVTG